MNMVVFIKDVGGVVKEKLTEWVKTRGIYKTEAMFRSRFPKRNVCTVKLEMKNNYDLKFQIFHKRLIVFFTIYEYTTNSQQDQLPTGLKAQLVKSR